MKIVINADFGGFSLSRAAVLRARELSNDPQWGGATIIGDTYPDGTLVPYDYGYVDVDRHDPILVTVLEEMGTAANGMRASLRIENVPTGAHYRISEYDGAEYVECRDEITWLVAT